MPRLFTGLEIPKPLCQELSRLRGGLSGAKWVDDENYHLTLRFIGDVDDGMADDIYGELARIDTDPFTVTIDGIMCFGGNKPRAIVVCARRDPSLINLQADHERAMRRAGAPAEPRNFLPHITIARLRSCHPRDVADYLDTRGIFVPQTFQVSRFLVYSSRASKGGGPFLVEAAYPLG